MTDIYILALNNGKYYVGKSENVKERLRVHQSGKGAAWTRIHKPIKIQEIKKNVGKFDEDSTTLELMDKYGIENVRGGTYSNPNLKDYQIEEINEKISHSNDQCMRCGRKGHFVAKCYAKTHTNGSNLDDAEDEDIEEDEFEDFSNEIGVCFRCGRKGHFANRCFAKTDRNGYEFEDDDDDDWDDDDDDDWDDGW